MRAHYQTKCRACGNLINVGEEITRFGKRGWAHVRCSARGKKEFENPARLGHDFESFGAFVQKAIHGETDLEPGQRSSINGSEKFTGTASIQEAGRLALNGWPEGLEKIKRFKAELDEKVGENLVEQKLNYDVAGGDWDIGRVLIGEPEAAMVWEEHETDKPIVHIMLNGTVSGMLDKEVIFRRGAGVCGLIDAFEKSGIRCQVTLAYGNRGYRSRRLLEEFISIKSPDEPSDIDRIVFALCHPSSFRRLTFSLWEQYPREVRDEFGFCSGGGYGQVDEISQDHQGDIYLGGALYGESQWKSDEATIRWILDTLKAQGVEVRQEVER